MANNKDMITYQQYFFLLIHTQSGVGVLSLPYDMHNSVQSDGWLSILIAGVVVQCILFAYLLLFKRFDSQNLLEISYLLLGKKIGKVISLFYSLYFISVGSLILVLYIGIIDRWILPYTPNWIIGALLVLTGIYLCVDGLNILARFFTLVTPLMVILFLLISYTLKDANIYYILPIGQSGIKDIFFGSKDAFLSMLGFEAVLMIFPLVMGSNRTKFKVMTFANLFITLLYAYLILVSFMYFSPDELKIIPEPLLYMLKSYTFKVIERTDLLFLSIWIIMVFTSFSTYLFLAAKCGKSLFKKAQHKKLIYSVGLICFGVSLIAESNILFAESMSGYITKASFTFLLFPVLLLLVSYLFKKTVKGKIHHDQGK
ncbi:GerAB/ArcD/ProY family transporter [Bacillus sp. ISL-41]|uniref:GerAB/ArcD/ProY family transporter n=1 Tax=Bacillus sp. ISL-41 TaxID=2819127 RepID=UPI001BE7CCC3|nr:GerAB/ArcD/ProY family transporter [Bacillus sp. ISL-41]MBT2643207.1 GerAB/ArcD/ProY family transporter [Bacillus sp. ISL-41]